MTKDNVHFSNVDPDKYPDVIAPTYIYQTQRERSISVTCSNLFTSQTLTATIQVFSDCFNSGNMFEASYRFESTLLKAFMSSIPVISGRIELTAKCENSTDINYIWTVEEQNTTDSTVWRKLNVFTPNAKVYPLAISGIGPGTFRLTCNLTVNATKLESIEDFMYVELINPPLVVELTGSIKRVLGDNVVVSLDAVSNSYDPVIGYRKENYLSFSWNCYQILENDLDSYFAPHSTDTTYRAKPSCNISLSSDGIITVPAASLTLNTWTLFEANITKDTRAAVAIQAIKIVEVPPPETTLTCTWNCESKRTQWGRMMYETDATCSVCSAAEQASGVYEWTFYKFNGSAYDLVDYSDSHFLLPSSAKLFFLDAGFLEQGSSYKAKVTFTVANIPPGSSETSFVVNEEPYGGTCRVSPMTGMATIDEFTFACSGWKDEGARNARDPFLDAREPLIYIISQIKGNESQLIYNGNEASAVQTLEVCPEEDDYVCVIEFRIRDMFKAEITYLVNITVTNPIPDITFNTFGSLETGSVNKTSDDEAVLNTFLERTITAMTIFTRYNDAEKTAKVATTYISAINTVEIRAVTGDDVMNTSVNEENVNAVVKDALERFTKEDPQTAKLLESTEVVSNTIISSINNLVIEPFQSDANNNSDGNIVPTTAPKPETLIMLSTILATVLKKPSAVRANVVASLAGGITSLSEQFVKTLKNDRHMEGFERAIEAIGTAQNNLIKNVAELVVEDRLEDIHGIEPFITRELSEGEERFNVIERKYLRKVADKKKKVKRQKMLRNIVEVQKNVTSTTDNMFHLVDKIILEESNETINYEDFSLILEKNTVQNLVDAERDPIDGATFGFAGVSEPLDDNEIVNLRIKILKKNIYIQGHNAKYITGPVIVASIRKQDSASLTISEPFITQTDYENAPHVVVQPKYTTGDAAKLFYHSFFYRALHADVCLSALPIAKEKVVYDMYFRSILPPTDMEYDDYTYYEVEPGVSGTRYCVKAGTLKRTGVAYVGLRPRLNEEIVVSRKRRSVPSGNTTNNENVNATNNGNVNATKNGNVNATNNGNVSATNNGNVSATDNGNVNSVLESPYLFRVTTITCFSWDGQVKDWRSTTCELKRDDEKNKTTCICPNTQEVVASVSFFVPPNIIDFSTVFSRFDVAGQAAVLSTLVVIFVLFVIAALFSRYKDSQDVLQWGVSLLEDNFREDCYFYLITVYTGMIRQGGTRSNIEFNITGEKGDTGIRVLTDGVRKEFGAGSVLHFIMAVPVSLGRLQCLRVWHDNSGNGNWASWYLNRMEVIDLQSGERVDFLCYKWLSFEAGNIEAILGVGSCVNMNNFKTMFFEHARVHVTDDHLWLSTVFRPVKSHFSRVQRVGCCLAFLLLSMISNAMFFQGQDFKDRKQLFDFELGPFKFTLSQIWISFLSAIITAIPVFVMMFLFKKSKLSKRQVDANEYTTHWMLPCFKRFKFYRDSVALQKMLVIKDIVDDEEGVLPHFCVYIGWVLVALASLVSAVFVLLYSAEWGKDISEEWLVTFFMSFFESLFILDPFKIVFLALIFAIILKKIKVYRPTVFDLKHICNMNKRIGKSATTRHLDYRSPFPEDVVEQIQFRINQQSKMHKAISEFLMTVFLLVLICSIGFTNRDPHGFLLRTNLQKQLSSPIRPIYKPGEAPVPNDGGHNTAEFYMWLNYTIMDAMFREENFNDDLLGARDRLLMSDLSNLRVGAPRLRLLRERKMVCALPYIREVDCIPRYSVTTEDTNDYCEEWNATKPCDENEGLRLISAAWTFVPAWKIWGIPITGSFNLYGGGGYIAELDISRPVAKKTIAELIETMWIDRQTRAVFLEFTVYSTNLNMFAYISLLSEFPETGAILHYTNIYTFRSLQLTGTLGDFVLVCHILFLIATIVWVVVMGVRLLKDRWTFFKVFWNIVELATVGLSFAAVILYFIRLKYTNEAIAQYKENPRIFINFYHISVWDGFFIYVVAILVALVTLRLIKVLGLTKVTRTVFTVLKQSSKTLPGFFFYIFLILLAFAACGTLFFGPFAREYKDIVTCLESLFSAVLGHTGFTKMTIPSESSWFGLIYFISFIVIVTFTLANIFMTILLDTMDMLDQDHSTDRNLELTTYLWQSAKEIITGKKAAGSLKSKSEKY
ncbi:uncharacterized protein LOC121378528 isoform X2 [Gigantopelta aegis]|uniref:uncharacterized protein LOC121378528 isoform X2 n=1 Tax=Gigantopelta aegis TaxID=1735272 RepID=UPI001B88E683|nr:uncharacterized protein LOC121378528 isoform X2 [Gigantopelta aegis]